MIVATNICSVTGKSWKSFQGKGQKFKAYVLVAWCRGGSKASSSGPGHQAKTKPRESKANSALVQPKVNVKPNDRVLHMFYNPI